MNNNNNKEANCGTSYTVTDNDLKGEIKDFPIEVVQKMVDRRIEQQGIADISVFQGICAAGFDSENTNRMEYIYEW